MSSSKELGMDDFLGHRTSGGGGNFLGKWKDRDGLPNRKPPLPPKSVDTWLHTRCGIVVVWRHDNFPRLVVREDRQTKQTSTEVWGGNWVCWEDEATLKRQYRRDDDGTRQAPPTSCPLCRMNEWLFQQVQAQQLDWLEPVFRFEGSRESKVLHAAGMYGGLGDRDMTDEQQAQMKAAGLSPMQTWKENCQAKAHYIFRVVDNDHPDKGVQIATEPALLGDKVKIVIADTMESWGHDEGNPLKNPYAIRWQHRPAEKEFGKRYHALKIDALKPSPDILKLIRETDAPDIGQMIDRFDSKSMRELMQRHALVDMPWDEFFAGAKDEPRPAAKPAAAKGQNGRRPAARPEPPPEIHEPEEEMLACDSCELAMLASANECPHCGQKYEVEGAPVPPPEPVKLPKRSEAKKAKAAPAQAKPTPGGSAAKGKLVNTPPADLDDRDAGGYPDNPDDDVPFLQATSHASERWTRW